MGTGPRGGPGGALFESPKVPEYSLLGVTATVGAVTDGKVNNPSDVLG